MADFYYSSSKSTLPQKIFQIYAKTDLLEKNVLIYRNYESEHYEYKGNSAYIVGTAQVIDKDKDTFIYEVLDDFNEGKLPIIQKKLIGQYILLIYANEKWYIHSDFMNIRSIYYDLEKGEVSSNFGALSSFHTGFEDDYTSLEFQAMDKCLYPVTLGNTTSIKSILRLQPCQYIVIDKEIMVRDFTININNKKIEPAEACADTTLSLLSSIIRKYADFRAVSTITGGYDSRLISSLCASLIPNLDLRISTIEDKGFVDLSIGKLVAEKLGKRLRIYKTTPKADKDEYCYLTHGLSKENNLIIMGMIKHTSDYQIGFGGTMGTELYSSISYHHKEELIDSFVKTASCQVSDNDKFIQSFRHALEKQINYIENHILLEEKNPRDLVRLFLVFMTARFSSPLLSLSDIYGHQFEPYATFPIIENGLQIPYHYQGDSKTFGRFYLIPKLIMKKVNYKVGSIDTTHHQPLLPLSLWTLPHYVIGKLKTKFRMFGNNR
ncbi:MAG: hypothetical protein ACI4CA_03450 [Bacteroides sp.]